MTQSIIVSHNFEAAHRLFQLPGKCENIHGHSFQVGMELFGFVDGDGIVAGLDFGVVKKAFRGYLDSRYDHHLLLNQDDPFAGEVSYDGETLLTLPGLMVVEEDPTTENLARWIGEWARKTFADEFNITGIDICVQETRVNAATWTWVC